MASFYAELGGLKSSFCGAISQNSANVAFLFHVLFHVLCHKEVELCNFDQILTKNYVFRQYDWTKHSRVVEEAGFIFFIAALIPTHLARGQVASFAHRGQRLVLQ